MNKLIYWIERHKGKMVLIVSLFFIIPIFTVHALFKINLGISYLEAEWSAGDVLSYMAGFEALLASGFLSFLALKQTSELEQKEKEIREEESLNNDANTKRPFFVIKEINIIPQSSPHMKFLTEWKLNDTPYYELSLQHCLGKENFSTEIVLQNIGDGIAIECGCTTERKDGYNPTSKLASTSSREEETLNNNNDSYVKVDDLRNIIIDKEDFQACKQIILNYKNIVGVRYQQKIELKLENNVWKIKKISKQEVVKSTKKI